MRLNGSEMVMHALKNEGVKVVFGYPGGAALNLYDEIYKQNFFEHILTRHEQAAVHAADGYARASGKVGVAIVTSGPGFTNTITGIATAYMDSIPLVIISGQVPTSLIGTDAFQEIDAVGISRPCTKHNYLVKSIEELPRILKEAFYIARSGRPGPVHIDLPKDISATIGEFDYPNEIKLQTYKPTYKGNLRQIKKAAEAIKSAKKPLLYLGGGAIASESAETIKELCETTQIPAIETLMARGILSHNHPNLLGMVGMHGSYVANMAMSEADLLIALGARFDDRVTGKLSEFAKYAQIIHIDIDPSSISKIVNANYPIVGDIKSVLEELLPLLREGYNPKTTLSWREQLERYRKLHPLSYQDSITPLKPQWVLEKLGEMLGDSALISTDVGQHQMWTAQFYPFSKPRQFITSGGLGTMGFGLPAAMGAKKAFPDKISINISGDGSILMNIQELMTCSVYKIPVVNIVLNNNYLGMVRQWQTFFYENRYSETNLEQQPDFVKLVESFGGYGKVCYTKDDFTNALQEAIASNKPSFLDVRIDRMENVLPMVPTGGALFNMMLEYKE
ncbi:acetolactate synthase large subunit [Helicobacter winghamensis]|uniref:Acetolactate synthase n=1 Tax=Helicobacter winghamensis TaxID=157268 RepID=A0A2N3PKY2_9HELI|nr:acetolactate synthase large subunit [Helicobacter winghamensis]EEO26779.1 acetolactate synthase, large subunit, biosynthetic type [Helicobacter winghamensis ATCC BAA-430]PKT79128.1 acetolactate synthase, large subunit, biosynthetic type [Helicobacter winghamensis]PKT79192.1 acetolactate synthase, large subunit, biosynthetic type [Helicobacter winghamensis]PKT79280.1 acetolactate synthase, large subunit, biosynthetic type [Helicobacter winghamensis]PKT82346.1 acetolactate synthase, large sub